VFPIEFRVKGQVHWAFPESRVLCFPLGDSVSHIWTTHGREMFPIEFGIKQSMVKCIGH
jgi:hypothetical protein